MTKETKSDKRRGGEFPAPALLQPLALVLRVPEVPGLAVDLRRLFGVAHHPHPLRQGVLRQEIHDGPQGHRGRLRQRIAVHPGGDGAEVQRPDAVVGRQLQAAAVAGGQHLRLPVVPTPPDGPRGVEYVLGPQAVAPRQLGLSPLTASQGAALRQQLRPRRRVDGPVHPGAPQQRGVGGVDDGLRVGLGDVPYQNGKPLHA